LIEATNAMRHNFRLLLRVTVCVCCCCSVMLLTVCCYTDVCMLLLYI